nr:MIB2-like protein [Parasacculina yatsui]
MSVVEVGCRVLRGPDWNWGRQDGGDGHLGTLVEVGGVNSVSTPDKTVVVLWDTGNKTNYRVGYQNAYDLLAFDTAATGVKHLGTVCVGCRQLGIRGIRWRCSVCPEHDLCSPCYMNDVHDTTHAFVRYERPGLPGQSVPRRRDSIKMQVYGIFVGAKVVRGIDWEWGEQDGGKTGRVTELLGWEDESSRSVASVTWSATGASNVYRLGHQGKVDLKCCTHGAVAGGFHYVDHLPVLGKPLDASAASSLTRQCSVSTPGGAAAAAGMVFAVGDRVKVVRDVTVLQGLQDGHGGWNPRMTEYVGRTGVVHRITDRGDVRVQYPNNVRWTINPSALVRVSQLAAGDTVRVIDDPGKVRALQKGHGEWIDSMKTCLGKSGQVTRVYGDGDLRVTIGGQTWTVNPQCVVPLVVAGVAVGGASVACSGADVAVNGAEGGNLADGLRAAPADVNIHTSARTVELPSTALSSYISGILASTTSADQTSSTPGHRPLPPPADVPQAIVREAAHGRCDALRDLLDKHGDKVNCKSGGRTPLQLACHQGHLSCVLLLISRNADISAADDDGDSPLHYAAFGNQPEVIKALLSKGCQCNSVNSSTCAPLHVAVNKQHVECVRVLLSAGCDPNLQDSYGDTALHDAIAKHNERIVDLLTGTSSTDLRATNTRGFNTLHHAALKGNLHAVNRILERCSALASVAKSDGFTALHLAALNGHSRVVQRLLALSSGAVDVLNGRKQTPLHLAATQLHVGVVECLVSAGASLSLTDDDGNTCLHLVSARCTNATSSCEVRSSEAPQVHGIRAHLANQGTHVSGVQALACFLAEQGGDPASTNSRGHSCLDLLQMAAPAASTPPGRCSSKQLSELLLWYSRQRSVSRQLQLPSLAELQPPVQQLSSLSLAGDGEALVGAGDSDEPAGGAGAAKLENGARVCALCCELPATVQFQPCGHQLTCVACSVRMKRCLRCHSAIIAKQSAGPAAGSTAAGPAEPASADRLRQLESKIAEIEEVHGCSICLERRRNVVFLCGHGACAVCAHSLQNCHMCRKPITQKINVY